MNRTFFFSFTVLVFILGVMLGFQLRGANAGNTAVPGDREQKLAMEKKNLVEELYEMQLEINDLSTKLDQAGIGQKEAEEALRLELAKIKRFAGLSEVSGPGVEFIIQSRPGQTEPGPGRNLQNVTDHHLLKTVNELHCAGAQAVAINGQRITTLSEVRQAGEHINVNGVPLSPPYHVIAIGDTPALKGRLELKEGLVDYLNACGISVEALEKDEVVVPASDELYYEYAKIVKENM
ncbi:MAG: hypothetical protein BWY65_01139 [Firmicutes bacterium ADurb.Bin373]|nr:MAG: hypothetical protein BWY65_01139 [Firmicutes bacterium ADurb.Bin373]